MYSTHYFVFALFIFHATTAEDKSDYMKKRYGALSIEKRMKLGGNLDLSPDEQKVNKVLMTTKQKEITVARQLNDSIPPARHFFKAKADIDKSQVFKFIKRMPKGGVLHVHDFSMASVQWVVKNVTYMPDCYMCIDSNDSLQMHFFGKPPKITKDCEWELISKARKLSGDPDKFDQMLYSNLSIIVPNPEEFYSSQNVIWRKFGAIFTALEGLLSYVEAFKAYYLEALNEFYKDNVQYLEIRAMLPQLYELDGSMHDSFWTLGLYEKLTEEFKKSHSDFIGTKFIFTSSRHQKNKTVVADDIQKAIKMRHQSPHLFAGYDLVGQEDTGYPLVYFLDELLYPSQQQPPIDLPYFFHAGETDWQGQDVDENIIDALLLNTTRIGHGYAMVKHPVAQRMARDKVVAIEVNPISNQVLGLVADLRNHMAGPLMAQDFPVVISCDDPALWGAEALSYDFYEAFMGLSGTWSDLATLKKLTVNSINEEMTFLLLDFGISLVVSCTTGSNVSIGRHYSRTCLERHPTFGGSEYRKGSNAVQDR